MKNNLVLVVLLSVSVLLMGCQSSNLEDITKKPAAFFESAKVKLSENINIPRITPPKIFDVRSTVKYRDPVELRDVYDSSLASAETQTDFLTMVRSAVKSDPYIQSLKAELQGSSASVDVIKAQKEFQVSGAIYGGIEDLTDNNRGVAIVINAQKMLFDAGKLDAEVMSATLQASSGVHALTARMNGKAREFSSLWVNLDKYQKLSEKVQSRLQVLGPLISQLEQVASAGIGDVSQVAAAQRTVSMIRLMETDVSERLQQAQLDFINAFGMLPKDLSFDDYLINNLVPPVITEEMALNAPAIVASYDSYLASEAKLHSVVAKTKFTVGFEARTSTPFAGSSRDADESIGLIVSKTLFNGGLYDSEVEKAKADANARLESLRTNFRQGEKAIRNAEQTIKSMDKAINLSRTNLQGISDEITYLRQQLLIGGSSLDSILRAEARLYEAEADLINFEAQKRLAKLSVIAALGLFFN